MFRGPIVPWSSCSVVQLFRGPVVPCFNSSVVMSFRVPFFLWSSFVAMLLSCSVVKFCGYVAQLFCAPVSLQSEG